MRIKKLSLKIQLAMILLFLVIMGPMILYIYFQTKDVIHTQTMEELSNNTTMVYNMVDLYVHSAVENRLRAIAEKSRDLVQSNYDAYKAGLMTEDQAYQLSKSQLLNPVYGKIGSTGYLAAVDSKGVLVIHPRSEGADLSGRDFMQDAMTRKNGYLQYDFKNVDEAEPRAKAGYLSYFAPWDLIIWASSYKDEFQYLIDRQLLVSGLSNLKASRGSYTFIINSRGELIYHSQLNDGNLFDQSTPQAAEKLNEMMSFCYKQPGEVYQQNYLGEQNGEKRIGSMVYLKSTDWYIMTSYSEKLIYQGLAKILRVLLVICVIAFFAMNSVIFVLLKTILTPLRNIRQAVNSVSEGDISQQLEVSTADEIGQMTQDINHLLEGLNQVFSRMKSDVEVLNSSIQDLSSSSKEISTTSNEQASAVKEIVSTMEDSDSLSKGIESMIGEVANISTATKEKVDSGVNIIEESLVKMDEIRLSNDSTIAGIRSLSEKIEAIWDIVTIINSIADQTKIIAFNAELEASAAGDAGKNFQIVASEIRRLADSTVNSTTEIKSKINEIQRSSDGLITASEDGTNKIQEGGQLTRSLHNTFEEIMESSEISAGSAQEISTSIKQMVIAFEQILLTLKQISEGINNFVISTKSTSDISQRLKEIANSMSDFLSRYQTIDSGAEEDELDISMGTDVTSI